ncbi:MAG: hypothetical protein RI883_1035 [Bacteroidota bacterium]
MKNLFKSKSKSLNKSYLFVIFLGISLNSSALNITSNGTYTINPCGTNVTIYDAGGTGNYTNSNNGYVFLRGGGNTVISISGTWSIANGDNLFIYEGEGPIGTALQTLTNNTTGTATISFTGAAGKSYTLRFTSNNSGVSTGFVANVTYTGTCNSNLVTIPASGFNTVSCGTNSSLQDPGGTGNYLNNQNGYTVLQALSTSVISIVGSCWTEASFDYVAIYVGVGTGSTAVATYSGLSNFSYTGAAGQTLTIRFYSDVSNVNPGCYINVMYSGSCVVNSPPLCVASAPTPADLATNISITPTLSWVTVSGATGYDVYFSTNQTLVNNLDASVLTSTNQVGLTYNPGSLNGGTTYFWKVVPRNAFGAASGCSTWRFTTICSTVAGAISSNLSSTVVNDAITYNVTGSSGSVLNYQYSFNNFSTIAGTFTTSTNPWTINVNSLQPSISVRATTQATGCSQSITNIVTTTLICAQPSSNMTSAGDYIKNVIFNTISNPSTSDASGDGYQNFQSITSNVAQGSTYNLTVSGTKTFGAWQGYVAWIDWNNDGDFDDIGENVLLSGPAASATAAILIPVAAVVGTTVTMRVMCEWNATPSTLACNSVNRAYGEIEEYRLVITPNPLPIELISFQANCKGNKQVEVTWSTASEHNASYYIIDKSRDGITWNVIETALAAGNTSSISNYSIFDENTQDGINYYRLTQYDMDGIFEIFNIVSANCSSNEIATTLISYPNPSNEGFYLDLYTQEFKGLTEITISDAKGVMVYSQEVLVEKGSNVFHIEDMNAAPGMYYIKVSNGTTISYIVKHSLR